MGHTAVCLKGPKKALGGVTFCLEVLHSDYSYTGPPRACCELSSLLVSTATTQSPTLEGQHTQHTTNTWAQGARMPRWTIMPSPGADCSNS